jgi:hypothetical protein
MLLENGRGRFIATQLLGEKNKLRFVKAQQKKKNFAQ